MLPLSILVLVFIAALSFIMAGTDKPTPSADKAKVSAALKDWEYSVNYNEVMSVVEKYGTFVEELALNKNTTPIKYRLSNKELMVAQKILAKSLSDEIDVKLVEAIASLGNREEEKGRKEADFIFEHFLSNGKTISLKKMEKHIEENYSYNTMAVQVGFKERMTYYENNRQALVFLQDDGDIIFKHADFV